MHTVQNPSLENKTDFLNQTNQIRSKSIASKDKEEVKDKGDDPSENRKLFDEFSIYMYYVQGEKASNKGPNFVKDPLKKKRGVNRFDRLRKQFYNEMEQSEGTPWTSEKVNEKLNDEKYGWKEDYQNFLVSYNEFQTSQLNGVSVENTYTKALAQIETEEKEVEKIQVDSDSKKNADTDAIEYSKSDYNQSKDWYLLGLRNDSSRKEQFLLERKLRNEFDLYVKLKREDITKNGGDLDSLNYKVKSFNDQMYGDHLNMNHWGQNRYFKLRDEYFTDYESFLTEKRTAKKNNLEKILENSFSVTKKAITDIQDFLGEAHSAKEATEAAIVLKNEVLNKRDLVSANTANILKEYGPEFAQTYHNRFEEIYSSLSCISELLFFNKNLLDTEIALKLEGQKVFQDLKNEFDFEKVMKDLSSSKRIVAVYSFEEKIENVHDKVIKNVGKFNQNLSIAKTLKNEVLGDDNEDKKGLNEQILDQDEQIKLYETEVLVKKEKEIKRREEEAIELEHSLNSLTKVSFDVKGGVYTGSSDRSNNLDKYQQYYQSFQKEKKSDSLVNNGQLTYNVEGNNDPNSIYYTRRPHWPGGKSGVTIGRGYDLGQKSKSKVINHFNDIGINTKPFLSAIGLKGEEAKNWVNKNKGLEITLGQQDKLFDIIYKEKEDKARHEATKNDVTIKYGATDWDNLNPIIKDTLIDLKYRGDYRPETRLYIQKIVAQNDLIAFSKVMKDKSFWVDTWNVPEDRFKRRVEYIEGYIKFDSSQMKSPQNSGGTKEIPAFTKSKISPEVVSVVISYLTKRINKKSFDERFIKLISSDLNSVYALLQKLGSLKMKDISEKFKGDTKKIYTEQTPAYYKHMQEAKTYVLSFNSEVSKKFEAWKKEKQEVITKAEEFIANEERKEVILKAEKDYHSGEIDMLGLRDKILPYTNSNGAEIIAVINRLPNKHQDNLAYALANKSSVETLKTFDVDLLKKMSVLLDRSNNWSEVDEKERVQKKIDGVLGREGEEVVFSGDVDLNSLIRKERLTPKEIKIAREKINHLPEDEKQRYYTELQGKVNYENQTDSKVIDIETVNKSLKPVKAEGNGGGICNLASVAMALKYLGVTYKEIINKLDFEGKVEVKKTTIVEKVGSNKMVNGNKKWVTDYIEKEKNCIVVNEIPILEVFDLEKANKIVNKYKGIPSSDFFLELVNNDLLEYEDVLDLIRQQDENESARTNQSGWSIPIKKMGYSVDITTSVGKKKKEWYISEFGSAFSSGKAIINSITGHIVRWQGFTEKGIIVDDPYGKRAFTGETRKNNEYNSDDSYGEDNLWLWDNVENHTMNWIAIISK